ncbi:hypothetical protein U0355_04615 [Salimicrobium sp. PL1-032A]|uniref:hypothetical protein n=1 Tax=Salimicrobium sp. PL1-032A TaxID=3095364 RepID=UPI003261904A
MNEQTKEFITNRVVEEFYTNHPWLLEKFGEKGKHHTRKDNDHHLEHLELSYELQKEDFFTDYTFWLKDVLVSRGVGTGLIIENYRMIQKYMKETEMDEQERNYYAHLLETSISYLEQMTNTR